MKNKEFKMGDMVIKVERNRCDHEIKKQLKIFLITEKKNLGFFGTGPMFSYTLMEIDSKQITKLALYDNCMWRYYRNFLEFDTSKSCTLIIKKDRGYK